MADENKQEATDRWYDHLLASTYQFGLMVKDANECNPWPDWPMLPEVMKYLMTELWDHGFSQTEIRNGFEAALANMPKYAAGEERRS